MKNFFCVCFFILTYLGTMAQGTKWQATVAEAFKKAKETNKPVCVEIYLIGCHVCESFVPVFNSASAGTYLNANFINLKVEANSAESKKMIKKFNIHYSSFPVLLFFDKNEQFMHHFMLGEGQGLDVVLNQASIALDSNRRSASWKKRYKNGERNTNLLIDYAQMCKLMTDTTENIQVIEELQKVYPTNEIASQTSWLITEKLVMDTENKFYQYWINHLNEAQKFANGHEKDVLGSIAMGTLYSSRGNRYTIADITKIKHYFMNLGSDTMAATRMTLVPEIRANLKSGQTLQAVALTTNYLANTSQVTAPELVFLTHYFNQVATDTHYQAAATEWLKKAGLLSKTPSDLADIYYETATLWHRVGNKIEANKQAALALSTAQSAKIKTDKFLKLLEQYKHQ